jgi:hypothetical protein
VVIRRRRMPSRDLPAGLDDGSWDDHRHYDGIIAGQVVLMP